MKAFFSFVAALVLSLSMAAQNKSFYDFTVKTIDGKEYPLSGLKGKKVLVVNVCLQVWTDSAICRVAGVV